MEFYLPSLFIIILAGIAIIMFGPAVNYTAMIGIALLLIIITFYHHFTLFYKEYANISWINLANTNLASSFITITIILLCLGYIIMLTTSGALPSLSIPPAYVPPPQTATNSLTSSIGNSLISSGLVREQPAMNALESGLSKQV
jgi:hypothetical protein